MENCGLAAGLYHLQGAMVGSDSYSQAGQLERDYFHRIEGELGLVGLLLSLGARSCEKTIRR